MGKLSTFILGTLTGIFLTVAFFLFPAETKQVTTEVYTWAKTVINAIISRVN